MIVSRAPLRFSLGGGGTDLPSYSDQFGGFVVSAAINHYVYVTASRRFYDDIRLAYSQTEVVADVNAIRHPIFREALRMLGIDGAIELTSVAELPANSGLGSSSSFTVSLLNALHAYKREFVSSQQLAEEACELEIGRLGEPIGKQDQYIAAFGNITALSIARDGRVEVQALPVRDEVLDELQNNLLIAYSGRERPARLVLTEQGERVRAGHASSLSSMHRIRELGFEVQRLLLGGDLDGYGALLHEHWTEKRSLADSMTDPHLDEIYELARAAGALGGKLMGAGGGGFFMFYVRPEAKRRLWEALSRIGLKTLRFRFDLSGAKIVANLQ